MAVKGISHPDRVERWAGVAVSAPALALVIALFCIPFLNSFFISFRREAQWTLGNYATVGRLYLGDILFTAGVSLIALVATLLVAVAIGGYLRLRPNRVVEFLFKIPLFIPFVVVGHAMRVFLAPHGLLNSALAQVGLVNLAAPPSIAFSWLGIVVALTWKNMAMALLLVLGAFRGVREEYLESARNVGAAEWRLVKDVLLPMAAGSVAVAAVLIFSSMLASFSIPLMIGSGKGAQMLMIDIYYRIIYQQDYGVANALGVISYLGATGAAIYYLRTVRSGERS
ncbi:Binding-protein-dependent transport system inner membrane component [Neomoorella glycerini]|uniref:Binding-protein-dependent transport system inner membrane component n=1 Tax=Neomoorella glycerini TaxID=55779 RepID=A0A6I5ZSH9_9FIRM|nr:ABC transporter permease subunit [Moorella glycerini]QGP92331.1 Binding-protein-dependent transport system inner membrane component [Moorella glycerini]